MENLVRKYFLLLSIFSAAFVLTNCTEDEENGPAPTAGFEISADSQLKQNEEIAFINTSVNGKSFTWSFGDGQVKTGKNVTHEYAGPGDYEVTLEASANGRRDVVTQVVTIEGLIPSVAFSVASEDNLKVGLPVNFINETVNGESFIWSFGDTGNSTSTEENPSFTYSTPGTYTVSLTATGTGGSGSREKTITVNANEDELYFIDNSAMKIRKIALKDPSTVIDVFDLPGFCMGLAYDPVNQEIYYTDDDNLMLYKNNLEGTDEVMIADNLNGPRDIALDITNNRVFLVERGIDQITEVDLTNGNKTEVYSVADDANFQLPVGLALYQNELFATAVEIDAESVWTGNIDGSDLSRIIDYSSGGYGYAIEVDEVNETIYFDDNDGGSLLRANLDGSNIIEIGTTTDQTYGIAINNEFNKVYWSGTDGVIRVANLDGSEEAVLKDVGADVRGLILRKSN